MKNPGLIKSFNAEGAIQGRRIVKFGTDDGQATQATAETDILFGVSEIIDADDGDRVDIVLTGIPEVEYGGNVSRGDQLTAGADGKAVKAAPAAGVNNRIVGTAMVDGVAGDYGSVLLGPGQVQGA